MKLYAHTTLLFILILLTGCQTATRQEDSYNPNDPAQLKLADYHPQSVFKIPSNELQQAKYPVIDMHSHAYVETKEELETWVNTMDENNVEKVIVHTGAYGEEFDRLYDLYTSVSDRFEMWCGFDMTAWGTPEFPAPAVAELERCFRKGAKGVGELSDKGLGEIVSRKVKEPGLHFDDDLFVPLFTKCAELGMPVNMHLGDPIWMYEPMDNHNDGYMNAFTWKIDLTVPGILDLDQLVQSLENTCVKNPNTTFIACHFINISHDYEKLGQVLDRHANLYIDNSARHLETAATPRASKKFYEKYADRIVFGTDNNPSLDMYRLNWRILETEDEHFYAHEQSYHWPLHGFGLSDATLEKIYRTNAQKITGAK